MKPLSLKLKLTLLYSFFMTLLTCIALALLFSLSNQEVLASAQLQLKKQVQDSLAHIEADDGELELDSDFYGLADGVYLSLYAADGTFLYGRIPYGFNAQPAFQDSQIQTVSDRTGKWYIFDLMYVLEEYGPVYVRGVLSVTKAESSFLVTIRFGLILLPLLVILTAVIGYRFTRRTLKPVRRITETVQKIRADEDLSRRVGLGAGTDEIYQLAGTFDELLTQLENAFYREKQFTSDVSHELRTPITVILSQCGVLLSDETLTDAQRGQLQLIERKAQGMAQLVSQLLLLSRADQGRQKLCKERLNISELMEMAAEEQQLIAEEKHISIHTDIEPDIFAEIDETFFIRMLVNLLSNAVSYGIEGGFIIVRLSRTGRFITGSVEDNGIGIAPEHLPHIWERFYRADSSRSGSAHSGLGLSMVKWIIEAHGGTITVESTKGKGSTFTFFLPL